jgi:chemotaxis signal transduction protein
MKQFFVVRIGRFFFAIPTEYVRRALPVIPHIDVPLLKEHFGGIVFYNKRFIAKLFLDSVLDIGLYRQTATVSTDSTVIFEVSGITFCATVNEVLPVMPVEHDQLLAIDDAHGAHEPIFPKREYLMSYFEYRQKRAYIYVLDMPRIFQKNFITSPPN